MIFPFLPTLLIQTILPSLPMLPEQTAPLPWQILS